MICKNCGANAPDNMNFCSSCGARLTPDAAPSYTAPEADFPATEPVYTAPNYAAPYPPVPNASGAAEDMATSVLIWGILGLVFSITGILGIVFSAIAMGKASNCNKMFGFLPSKGRVGKSLGIAGLVLGIVIVVFVLVMIVVSVILAASMIEEGVIPYYSGF